MTMQAQLHDGRVLEFPDGTDPAVIQSTVKRLLGVSDISAPTTGSEAATRPDVEMFDAQRPAEYRIPNIGPNRMGPPVAPTGQGLFPGVVRGLRDPVDAGAQLLARGLEAGAAGLDRVAGTDLAPAATGYRQNVEGINKEAATAFQNAPGTPTSKSIGRFAGNAAVMTPIAAGFGPGVVGSAAAGALGGTLQPVDTETDPNFWIEKAKQAGLGAATGAATSGAIKAITGIISPRQEVRDIVASGGTPTLGQIAGGPFRTVEEKLTSLPVLGDVIANGQQNSVQTFNRAAVNKALEPIGEKLNPKTLAGHDAIDEAGLKLSDAYNQLVPKLAARVDEQYASDLSKLWQFAQDLPGDRFEQFKKIFATKVAAHINPETGMITGQSLKTAESELGRLAREYGRSSDTDQRLLGTAIRETQAQLRALVERSNPEVADQLSNLNRAYAMFTRVEGAAGRIGSNEGVFTPNALMSAVRQQDSSLNHRAFARGNALMQDFAQAGKNVLGKTVADSGTAGRLMAQGSVPWMLGLATGLPAAPLYSGAGQRVLARALAARPEGAGLLSDSIYNLTPAAVGAAPSLLFPLLNNSTP